MQGHTKTPRKNIWCIFIASFLHNLCCEKAAINMHRPVVCSSSQLHYEMWTKLRQCPVGVSKCVAAYNMSSHHTTRGSSLMFRRHPRRSGSADCRSSGESNFGGKQLGSVIKPRWRQSTIVNAANKTLRLVITSCGMEESRWVSELVKHYYEARSWITKNSFGNAAGKCFGNLHMCSCVYNTHTHTTLSLYCSPFNYPI